MIKFKDLAHQEHADLLDDLETMADQAYTYVIEEMFDDIAKVLKKEKLSKSDKLPRGWTGEVPKIEANFDDILSTTIGRYLDALKYILLGDMAGPDARKAAKALGLPKKIIPGIVQSAYLDEIDTQRAHGEALTGKEPKTMPKELITESMANIQKRTERFMNESFMRLQNRLLSAIELEAQKVNDANTAAVGEIAHGLLPESGKDAVADASEVAKDKLAAKDVVRAAREAAEAHRTDWNRLVNADVQLASAVATHQSVQEIFGASDDDVRVAYVAFRDEKACAYCKQASRNPDGSFKLYKMSDFQPAGYNYGKKRADWKLVIPPGHPNCRCSLVYVPKGFSILNNGSVVPTPK